MSTIGNLLWVISDNRLLLFRAGRQESSTDVRSGPVTRIVAADGGVWLADGEGIRQIDIQGDRRKRTSLDHRPKGNWDIAVLPDGTVWRTSSAGTIRWSPST